MLFTGWEVRTGKYFVEVSEAGRGTLLRPRQNIFPVQTDLNGKYRFYFFIILIMFSISYQMCT